MQNYLAEYRLDLIVSFSIDFYPVYYIVIDRIFVFETP